MSRPQRDPRSVVMGEGDRLSVRRPLSRSPVSRGAFQRYDIQLLNSLSSGRTSVQDLFLFPD